MKIINYSFIIPHKNIPDLLERCIKSIPQRDDIEVIVVDDNSTQENICKLKKIEQLYSIVRFFYTSESKGAGFARNVGISQSKGNFLIFADADDFFTDKINILLDKYEREDVDIVYFFSSSCLSDDIAVSANKNSPMMEVLNKYLIDKDEEFLRFKYAVPWGKIVNKRLIEEHNILYDEVLAGNDVLFSAKSGYYAKKICVDKIIGYSITERSGSIITNESKEYLDARFESRLNLMKFLRSISKEEYRHPIGDIVFKSRYWGIKYILNKIDYLKRNGYGGFYLIFDIVKYIIYYPIRKFKYVFCK